MSQELNGLRLLVTRGVDDQASTAAAIEARGGIAIACPTIQITLPHDRAPLIEAGQRLAQFDWIVFTSRHAVRFFWEGCGSSFPAPFPARVAAIGDATARELQARGLPVHFTPQHARGSAFIEEMPKQHDLRGAKMLLPLSAIARRTVPDGLRAAGAEVIEVTAYQNSPVDALPSGAVDQICRGEIDWALFFSPSTAENFLLRWPYAERSFGFRVASIGPTTTVALHQLGLPPDLEADPHTLDGLLDGLARYQNQ